MHLGFHTWLSRRVGARNGVLASISGGARPRRAGAGPRHGAAWRGSIAPFPHPAVQLQPRRPHVRDGHHGCRQVLVRQARSVARAARRGPMTREECACIGPRRPALRRGSNNYGQIGVGDKTTVHGNNSDMGANLTAVDLGGMQAQVSLLCSRCAGRRHGAERRSSLVDHVCCPDCPGPVPLRRSCRTCRPATASRVPCSSRALPSAGASKFRRQGCTMALPVIGQRLRMLPTPRRAGARTRTGSWVWATRPTAGCRPPTWEQGSPQ